MTDDLREFRQRVENRRKRLARKQRLLRLGNLGGLALGLCWMGLLLGALLWSPRAAPLPMPRVASRAADVYPASSSARLSTFAARAEEPPAWRPRVRAAPRPWNVAATSAVQVERRVSEDGIGSPISSDGYVIISALHAKLEGLEAYRKYGRDGDQRVWKQLSERDSETVRLLCDELEKLVRDGKLRSSQSANPAR